MGALANDHSTLVHKDITLQVYFFWIVLQVEDAEELLTSVSLDSPKTINSFLAKSKRIPLQQIKRNALQKVIPDTEEVRGLI